MSKKKRRRRSRGTGIPAREPAPAPVTEEPVRGNGQVARRPRGLFGAAAGVPSPYPPILTSVGRGVLAAGRSMPVILVTFVAPTALWLTAVATGAEMTPKSMVNLLAVSPMHVLFADLTIAFTGSLTSPVAGLAIALGLSLARVVLFGLVIALMAPDLGWSEERPLHAWRRAIPHLVLVALALFGVAGAIPLLLQGFAPQFTGFVQLGAPLIGLYLLGFAPIAAVVDGDPYREAVRRSIRAARLPGGGHLSFILLYFAFVFFLFAGVPGGPATPLTPSVATWGFTLIGSLFHVGVLGALTFRWLAVRDRLAEAPPPRR